MAPQHEPCKKCGSQPFPDRSADAFEALDDAFVSAHDHFGVFDAGRPSGAQAGRGRDE